MLRAWCGSDRLWHFPSWITFETVRAASDKTLPGLALWKHSHIPYGIEHALVLKAEWTGDYFLFWHNPSHSSYSYRYCQRAILNHGSYSIFHLCKKKKKSIFEKVIWSHLLWHLKLGLNGSCISLRSQVICHGRQVFCMLFGVFPQQHLLPARPPSQTAHTHSTVFWCLLRGLSDPTVGLTLSQTQSPNGGGDRALPFTSIFLVAFNLAFL